MTNRAILPTKNIVLIISLVQFLTSELEYRFNEKLVSMFNLGLVLCFIVYKL